MALMKVKFRRSWFSSLELVETPFLADLATKN